MNTVALIDLIFTINNKIIAVFFKNSISFYTSHMVNSWFYTLCALALLVIYQPRPMRPQSVNSKFFAFYFLSRLVCGKLESVAFALVNRDVEKAIIFKLPSCRIFLLILLVYFILTPHIQTREVLRSARSSQ